jgi:hypothetical protein
MAEIGATASVIGIAGTGAKLSIALFEFASTIGYAATEITAIGIEVSQFCVVVKQIESTLTKARKTVRYSISAIWQLNKSRANVSLSSKKSRRFLGTLKRIKLNQTFSVT